MPTDEAPVRSILVAVDGSAPSRAAGSFAVHLAKRLGARLTVIHVIDPEALLQGTSREPGAWTDLLPAMQEAARGIVGVTVREARALAVSHAVSIVQGYDVPGGIVAEADAVAADLVVVGSHGRRGVARALVGSVAERVVRTAKCPVLVYRRGEPGAPAEPSAPAGLAATRPSVRAADPA